MSNTNTNRILVIGGTGTVGSALLRNLVAGGENVVAATRDPSRKLGHNIATVRYDFDDPSTVDAALDGVDRIFYLTRPADPRAAEVAAPLFEKARALGVRHIVNMSALGASDDSALRQVELALEASGVPYSLLRPNWFMQNFSSGNYGDMIRGQRGLFLPGAAAACSFIDIHDIAAVAAKLLVGRKPTGTTYVLTGPESLRFAQVAQKISAVAGSPITYMPISDADLASALAAQGMPDYVTDFMLGLFRAMRSGQNAAVTSDVHSILGHAPRSFAAFASESVASFGPAVAS